VFYRNFIAIIILYDIKIFVSSQNKFVVLIMIKNIFFI